MMRAAVIGLGRRGRHVVQRPALRAGQHVVTNKPFTEEAELEAFADAAAGGAPYACPPEDALHGVAVLEAIVKSARSGRLEPVD